MTEPQLRNIRLTVAYEGTYYCGWQIQPVAPTVQGVIERFLARMTQTPVRIRAAGRTDAGVHAQGQVASFKTESNITVRQFLRGLNSMLPEDIGVLKVEQVGPQFDARRTNHGKHYRYTLLNSRIPVPHRAPFSLRVFRPLDLTAMATAAQHLVGTHEFDAFRSADCERETTLRTIYRCTVAQEGPFVHIDVDGSAFLRNMVRIIAGTLLEVGKGRRDAGSLSTLLASRDRTRAGMTLPPHGLCMMKVFL